MSERSLVNWDANAHVVKRVNEKNEKLAPNDLDLIGQLVTLHVSLQHLVTQLAHPNWQALSTQAEPQTPRDLEASYAALQQEVAAFHEQIEDKLLTVSNQLAAVLEPLSERVLAKPLKKLLLEGLIVRAGKQYYVIPCQAIQRVLHPTEQAFATPNVTANYQSLRLGSALVPIQPLNESVEARSRDENSILLILDGAQQQRAILVDEIIGQQHILLQQLHAELAQTPEICGYAVLGSGEVAAVIDVDKVVSRPLG